MLWGDYRYGVNAVNAGAGTTSWPFGRSGGRCASGRLVFSEDGKPTGKKRDAFLAAEAGGVTRLGSVRHGDRNN